MNFALVQPQRTSHHEQNHVVPGGRMRGWWSGFGGYKPQYKRGEHMAEKFRLIDATLGSHHGWQGKGSGLPFFCRCCRNTSGQPAATPKPKYNPSVNPRQLDRQTRTMSNANRRLSVGGRQAVLQLASYDAGQGSKSIAYHVHVILGGPPKDTSKPSA